MHIEEFGAEYDKNIQKIYSFLYFRTRHKQTAEDLTSTTFTKALQNLKGFDPAKASFSTWLFTIARNTLFDFYRTNKVSEELDLAENINSGQSIESAFDVNKAVSDVRQFLSAIPNDQREIILLRIWDDLSYKQIAEITGKTETNCKVIVSRALTKIKKSIPQALIYILIFGSALANLWKIN